MGLCNPSQKIQARHQFFVWKLETRRRKNSPSAPLALERSKKLIIGSYLTPPLDFTKPRKVGLTLISR